MRQIDAKVAEIGDVPDNGAVMAHDLYSFTSYEIFQRATGGLS